MDDPGESWLTVKFDGVPKRNVMQNPQSHVLRQDLAAEIGAENGVQVTPSCFHPPFCYPLFHLIHSLSTHYSKSTRPNPHPFVVLIDIVPPNPLSCLRILTNNPFCSAAYD